jgi:hypothetical protein
VKGFIERYTDMNKTTETLSVGLETDTNKNTNPNNGEL